MKHDKIKIDKLAEAVTADLDEYSEHVNASMEHAAEDVADKLAQDINSSAPRRTGAYSRSWTYQEKYRRDSVVGYTVYAEAPGYRLAHLLENGHIIKTHKGDVVGHVAAVVHIKPQEEKAAEEFVKVLKGDI